MIRHALIAGVTGIIGRHLAEHLVERGGWKVSGISRGSTAVPEGVASISADLNNAQSARTLLKTVDATHVFITAWSRQATEAGNCRVNGAMVANLLNAVSDKKIAHVALVTGLKHYLGPFEAYASAKPVTPFREEQPRLSSQNFYYVQEDAVLAAAARDGFTWSVHRHHTLIGYAVGNAMNMASTLAAYAAICRETGRPFVFPGSLEQYVGAIDVTDGRILAKHLEWASTTPAAANAAFNVVNGEIFRWNWLWRGWQNISTSKPATIQGARRHLQKAPQAWKLCGTRSLPSMAFRKIRSAGLPPGGIPIWIWAARSKTSQT